MRVSIASDHAGNKLKSFIVQWLKNRDVIVDDKGPHQEGSVDYPSYSALIAESIQKKECEWGVLVCGSGIGMSIAANRFHGVRAALCRESLSAKLAREHNDANVLVLGERFTGTAMTDAILQAWWDASFTKGRHEKRIQLIEQLSS